MSIDSAVAEHVHMRGQVPVEVADCLLVAAERQMAVGTAFHVGLDRVGCIAILDQAGVLHEVGIAAGDLYIDRFAIFRFQGDLIDHPLGFCRADSSRITSIA